MQNEEEAEQVAGMVVEVVEVMGEVWCGGGGGQQRACMKKSGCSRVALMKFLPKCANCRMRSATSPLSAAMPTLARSIARCSGGDSFQESFCGGGATAAAGRAVASCGSSLMAVCEASMQYMNIETTVIASTGVCSALSPPRPFSKMTTVNDLSNHLLRPEPHRQTCAHSSLVCGAPVSKAMQKSADSTSSSDLALVGSPSSVARVSAHSSRGSEVSTETGGWSESSSSGRSASARPWSSWACSCSRLSGAPDEV